MSDEITLTIDGIEVKTQTGTNVLQAATDAGIYIPYLCYYPGMKAFGACRMCVVRFEEGGPPGNPASCTVPAADGMVVTTTTDDVKSLRKGIMELLISEHPHGCLNCHRIDLCGPTDICLRHVKVNDRCVTCPKNERCELKDTARYMEMDLDTPLTYNNRHLPLSVGDPFLDMDMNLCIVCGRCVRVCDEIRGDFALAFTDRSGRSLIGTTHGTSLLESGCEFCGACIDVCPTGALVERDHKWDKAVKNVESICPHCPVGCSMTLEVDKRNRIIRSIPNRQAVSNRGQACFKGKFGLGFVNSGRRLRKPLIRQNGTLSESTWIEAVDLVASKLQHYRNGSFGIVASPRGTNEDSYIAQKFARVVMGTNNVDISSNMRPELVSPLGEMLGYEAGTNTIWELEQSKCFLIVSSNMTEEQNVAAVPIKKALGKGASSLVIDQRETELTRSATMWLRPIPGSEVALIGGMLRVLFDESLDDHEFLATHCNNLSGLKKSLWAFDLLKVSDITGISIEEIQEAARMFVSAKPAAILYGLETVSSDIRTECVTALVNLALATGNIGKPSSGLYPLYAGANEQGAKDMGCVPRSLPGYHLVSSEGAREKIGQAWGAPIPTEEGVGIRDVVSAIEDGHIKALHVIGDSPHFTNNEVGDFEEGFKKLDFMVVQTEFETEFTQYADVVFPAATFAEKEGTYTNLERRVQVLNPALGARGDEEPDWMILSKIARTMGFDGFDHTGPDDVFEEINSIVKLYAGMTYERLREKRGLQWPYEKETMAGTEILYSRLEKGMGATLKPMTLVNSKFADNKDYPLTLAMGRVLHQNNRAMAIEKSGKRNVVDRQEIFQLHKSDAESLQVKDGDFIEVVSEWRRLSGVAELTAPQKGLVCTTQLFGQLATMLDMAEHPDSMLNVDTLPLVHVRVEKLGEVAADD